MRSFPFLHKGREVNLRPISVNATLIPDSHSVRLCYLSLHVLEIRDQYQTFHINCVGSVTFTPVWSNFRGPSHTSSSETLYSFTLIHTMSNKSIRGQCWTTTELESLNDSIQFVLPIWMNEWDAVLAQYQSHYSDTDRNRDGINRKFVFLQKNTDDPNLLCCVKKDSTIQNLTVTVYF